MAKLKVKLIGFKEMQANFTMFPRILNSNLRKKLRKSLFDLERITKPITPLDTGYLRSSFVHTLGENVFTFTNVAPYAVYVHEGTIKWPLSVPPKLPGTVRQFMLEGLKKARPEIERNMKTALEITTKRMARV